MVKKRLLQLSVYPLLIFKNNATHLKTSYTDTQQTSKILFLQQYRFIPKKKYCCMTSLFQITKKICIHVNINSSIPDFKSFAKIWSSFADGVKIFYKTPKHLKLYFNKRVEASVFHKTTLLNENICNNVKGALIQLNRKTNPIASIKAPTPIDHYSGHQRRLLPNDYSSLTTQRHERQLIPSPSPIAISPPMISALTINNTPSALLLPRDRPPTNADPTDVNPRPELVLFAWTQFLAVVDQSLSYA